MIRISIIANRNIFIFLHIAYVKKIITLVDRSYSQITTQGQTRVRKTLQITLSRRYPVFSIAIGEEYRQSAMQIMVAVDGTYTFMDINNFTNYRCV